MKIIVHVRGGIVQDIVSDEAVEIMVIDYDGDQVTEVDWGDGRSMPAYVVTHRADVEPEYVAGRFAKFINTNGKEC